MLVQAKNKVQPIIFLLPSLRIDCKNSVVNICTIPVKTKVKKLIIFFVPNDDTKNMLYPTTHASVYGHSSNIEDLFQARYPTQSEFDFSKILILFTISVSNKSLCKQR